MIRRKKRTIIKGPVKIRPFIFNFNDPIIDIEKGGQIIIGNNVSFSRNIYLEAGENHHLFIGDNVKIGAFAELHGNIRIEENVLLAPFCFMSSGSHNISMHQTSIREADSIKPIQDKEIIIKKNSWLCRGAHIFPGVTISENSIVGSNTIIKENVPAFSVAITSPKLNIISRLI